MDWTRLDDKLGAGRTKTMRKTLFDKDNDVLNYRHAGTGEPIINISQVYHQIIP